MCAQARLGVHAIKQLRECDCGNAITQSADHVGNAGEGVPCACVHASHLASSSGGDDVTEWGSIGRTDAWRSGGTQ